MQPPCPRSTESKQLSAESSEAALGWDEVVYSTYIGGYGNDGAVALALDRAGHVYVTGTTIASNFPTTPGAFQRKSHGGDLKQASRGMQLSRNGGRFAAKTGPLQAGSRWRIEIGFEGRQPWDRESLCRRVHIGTKRPSRWTRLQSKKC